MTKQFATIKKKRLINAVLHCIAFGACCGLFVCGALLLVLKLLQIDPSTTWYVLISCGISILSAATLLCFIFPTKYRLARQLDNQHALGERIQTLVEYEKVDSAMLALQRQDAEQKLSQLKRKPLGYKKIIFNCLLPIACATLFTVALIIPKKAEAPPEPYKPPVVDISPIEKNQLQNLIENITVSNLKEQIKQSYLLELNALLEYTSKKITEDERTAAGQASLDKIIAMTAEYTTYEELSDGLKDVFELISEAVKVSSLYYTALGENELVNFNAISGLTSEIEKTTDAMVLTATNQLITAMFEDIAEETDENWATYTLTLAHYCNSLTTALSGVPDGQLKSSFNVLLEILQKWGTKQPSDGYKLSAINTEMAKDVKSNFNGIVSVELSNQAYTKLMERHTILILCNIFGLEIPEKDLIDDDTTFKPGVAPDTTTDTDDKKYPSANELYDKNSQDYKHYVEVYEKYSGNISAILNDPNVPPELYQVLRAFYENFQKSE